VTAHLTPALAGSTTRTEENIVSTARYTAAEARAAYASLGLTSRQGLLLSAVHEAGHAVAADSAGVTVTRAAVHADLSGLVTVEGLPRPGDGPAAVRAHLPALLAVKLAGYAASAAWLKGRGTDPAVPPVGLALNALAASDGQDALRYLEAAGCPGASLGPAGDATLRILLARWETVLRLGYALARRRSLSAPEIGALLAADPYRAAGRAAYRTWRAAAYE
jgi:hypothetical protein